MPKLNLSIGLLVALQLLVGVFIQLAVLRSVGAGRETDAFVAAQTMPAVIAAILTVALQSVWQPKLAMASVVPNIWHRHQRSAQGQALLVFAISGTVMFSSAGIWIPVLFSGFSQEQLNLTMVMTAPLLLAGMLNGHSALLSVALRTVDQFVFTELVNLSGSLLGLALIVVLVPHFGVVAASWILLLRAMVVCSILFIQAKRPWPALRSEYRESETWRHMRPILLGASIYKSAPLVDRYWASQAQTGSLTIFNLAQTAMNALGSVLERSISGPITPELARMVGKGDIAGTRKLYRQSIAKITLLTLCICAVLLAVRPLWNSSLQNILRLSPQASEQMWILCLLFLGFVHVAASGTVLVSIFYAMKDTSTPAWIGVIGFAVGVTLKTLLFGYYDINGLALATSIYYVGNLSALLIFLERSLQKYKPEL